MLGERADRFSLLMLVAFALVLVAGGLVYRFRRRRRVAPAATQTSV
jgi:LPXTG-motif cell wall-anchored protein